VECKPLGNFWPAEEYHQKYLEKNPNGYCHIPNSLFPEAETASGWNTGRA
jgi:peptide methionine sulfoxide reductase MsrA